MLTQIYESLDAWSTQRKRPGQSGREWMNRQSDQSEMGVLAGSGAIK